MNNVGYYIFALIAIVIAALILKHVVGCLMRCVVVVVLLLLLAIVLYFVDPEIQEAVKNALASYQEHSSAK